MSEKREVILEAKHVTRRFAASHGRTVLNGGIVIKYNANQKYYSAGEQ